MPVLFYRHNSITRFTHWMDAIILVVLFMSGLQIFNAFPQLHWGSKAEPEEAFFSITASNNDGDIRGTTDLFGWLFVLNGLLYFVFNFFNGHMRKFLFTPRDAARVPAMILYYLHLRRASPQDSEYNPLQKMAYTSVFLVLTPLVLLSGLAMSPQLNVAFNWLPAAFGGRQSARSIHFILAFAFLLFTFGHVFMVLTTGFFNNMRSMVTGWYREKVAVRVEVAAEAPPIAPVAVSTTLTPAVSLEEGEGDKKAKTEEEPEPSFKTDPESSSQEERRAD